MNFVFKFEKKKNFHHLLEYCDKSGEIIQSTTYDNYDDFNMLTSYFSLNFISLFRGLFNEETNLRVAYVRT
jgi:hypothetical protein